MSTLPKAIKSKSIYKNNYLEILVDTLKLDNKQWEHVHFVKPNENGVAVIPHKNDKIFLLKQYRHPIKEYLWQIPMGQIEKGQSPEEAAKAELQEEAGFAAKSFEKIGIISAEPGMSSQKEIIYVAKGLSKVSTKRHYNEIVIKARWFDMSQIDKMIKTSQIICGFTLSSILLYKVNYLN